MLTFHVIPFFLAVVLPDFKTSRVEYAFDVEIYTQFENQSEIGQNAFENKAHLLIEMKCQPLSLDKLKCFIERSYNFNLTGTNTTGNHTYEPPEIINKRVPCVLTFDRNGTVHYHVDMEDNDEDKSFLLNLYRMFGDQLTISAKTKYLHQGYQFTEIENSNIGRCATFYQINRQPGIHNRLTWLLEPELTMSDKKNLKLNKTDTLHISKLRHLDQCSSLHNYVLGEKIWPDLVPVGNSIQKITKSHSLTLITLHSLTSFTENTFELYNKKREVVGLIRETMEVRIFTVTVTEETKSNTVPKSYNTEDTTFFKENKEENEL